MKHKNKLLIIKLLEFNLFQVNEFAKNNIRDFRIWNKIEEMIQKHIDMLKANIDTFHRQFKQ